MHLSKWCSLGGGRGEQVSGKKKRPVCCEELCEEIRGKKIVGLLIS